VALATSVAQQPPAPTPSLPAWCTRLDAGLATARAEHRLVLICFNEDGEALSERALQMYRSPEFAKATAGVVTVLCAADDHGGKGAPCPRFFGCTCAEHIACEKEVRRHLFGASKEALAPMHVLLHPDATLAWIAVHEVVPADLYRAIAAADKVKAQPPAPSPPALHKQLAGLSSKAARGGRAAYLQLQAMLAQLPPPRFAEGLQAVSHEVAERLVHDLGGYERERALALLDAAATHPSKVVREAAVHLAAEVRARPPEKPQEAAPAPAGPAALTAPLPALAPPEEFAHVRWVGKEETLAACRGRVTLLWFFVLEAPDLADSIAAMNEFAATHRARGVEVLGFVASGRASEAAEKVAALGARFPVAAYVVDSDSPFHKITRFPSWVVLDPDCNVVHRSPQDGTAFDPTAARTLAVQMATSPAYAGKVKAAPAK